MGLLPRLFCWSVSGCLGSLGAGWKAAGIGGVGGFGGHLAEGGRVSLHIGVGGAILGEQAGRKGVHGGMRPMLDSDCKIWCGFTEKAGREGGHGGFGRHGKPACIESGCNGFVRGWLVPVWLWLVPSGCLLHPSYLYRHLATK